MDKWDKEKLIRTAMICVTVIVAIVLMASCDLKETAMTHKMFSERVDDANKKSP